MKTKIESIQQLLDLFPFHKRSGSNAWAAPCPFCAQYPEEGGVLHEKDGILFLGDDRFVIYETRGCYCRVCSQNNRGPKKNGYYSHAALAEIFQRPIEIAGSSDIYFAETNKPLTGLWTQHQVDLAHSRVDYAFWSRYGWSIETIKRFKLGKGTLYTRNPDVNVIPMILTHIGGSLTELYYMASRAYQGQGKVVKERTPGSVKPYMWLVRDDPSSTTLYVVEGEKDLITCWQEISKNVVASFGVNHWSASKAKYLVEHGFRHVVVLGDRDEAGVRFSHFVAQTFRQQGITAAILDWSTPLAQDVPAHVKDITEYHQYYVDFSLLNLAEFVKACTTDVPYIPTHSITSPMYIERVENPVPPPEIFDSGPLIRIRGTGPGSIDHAIRSYLNSPDRLNTFLMLRVGPGAGKTTALIKIAEEQVDYTRLEAKQALLREIEELERDLAQGEAKPQEYERLMRLKDHFESFDLNVVSFYGQYKNGYKDLLAAGINPDLWYDFQARSPENCQNYELTLQLAAKNQNIGSYCPVCPFHESCRASGYLSQDVKKLSYPIVFYRHPHLQNSPRHGLIIIDEDPSSIYETPLEFSIKDLSPAPFWYAEVDQSSRELLEKFIKALKATMAHNAGATKFIGEKEKNPLWMISGGDLIKLLEENFGEDLLVFFNQHYDEICSMAEIYHPNYASYLNGDKIYKQFLPDLLRVLKEELVNFKDRGSDYPTRLHLVAGNMQVFTANALVKNTPIIVSDATGIPEVYEALLRRKPIVYAPVFKNPNCVTLQVIGNEYTKSTVDRMLSTLHKPNIKDADGLIIDDCLVDVVSVIKTISERHDKLLVVTHKALRQVLEDIFSQTAPNPLNDGRITFGHYGSLRGTNAYSHYSAVLLLGVFRVPYDDVWKIINLWASLLGYKGAIPKDTEYVVAQYHSRTDGHTHRTFNHPLGRQIVDRIEAGEAEQVANRIRPHSSHGPEASRKTVYVFASRPLVPFVTEVMTYKDFMKIFTSDKFKEFSDYCWNFYLESGIMGKRRKWPTYADLSKRFSLSFSVVKKWLDIVKQKASALKEV